MAGAALERLAARARAASAGEAAVLWNGDAVLAARLGFDGAHWPEALIPPAPEPAAARLAWGTAAAHSHAAVGVGALRGAVERSPLPVYAPGGVTPERVRACLDAGAAGVAVVSGVLSAPSRGTAIDAYLAALAGVAA